MARMHSRKKVHSGSKPPLSPKKPIWLRYTAKEIEMLIGKFAKEGKSTSEIGILLRDTYGIPDIQHIIGKRVSVLLKEKNIVPEFPEDIMSLMKRAAVIRKHLEQNRHDETATRGLLLTESKIHRLGIYYKAQGRLAIEWKYDPKKKIYVE